MLEATPAPEGLNLGDEATLQRIKDVMPDLKEQLQRDKKTLDLWNDSSAKWAQDARVNAASNETAFNAAKSITAAKISNIGPFSQVFGAIKSAVSGLFQGKKESLSAKDIVSNVQEQRKFHKDEDKKAAKDETVSKFKDPTIGLGLSKTVLQTADEKSPEEKVVLAAAEKINKTIGDFTKSLSLKDADLTQGGPSMGMANSASASSAA